MKYVIEHPRAALLAAAALFAAAAAHADYKAGMDAMATRNYAKARVEFESEPANGAAIYQLGRMALLGLGEPRNDTRAAGLMKRAADAGHAAAKLDYVYALGGGQGVEKDSAQALRLLDELVAAGDVDGMLLLGRALRFGWWDIPKDPARAMAVFGQAMERGDQAATTYYAIGLIGGLGAPKDVDKGVALLRQAADGGQALAQVEIARMLLWGESVPKDQPAAVEFYRKAAETGAPAAQYGLSIAYLNGWGVPRDAATAARWADASARQGYAFAQVQLGDAFRNGNGVPRLRNEAYYWYSVAAKSTSAAAERANERRALLSRDMTQAEIDAQVKRADAFVAQPGFRPRAEALPPLARGDTVQVGTVKVDVPLPRGYGNGWQVAELLQAIQPNDPDLRPLLMVLTRQEDMDRMKLGMPGAYRSIEVARLGADASVQVTPSMFADMKKQLRDVVTARVAEGAYKLEANLRDDDRVYSFVRSGVAQPNRVEGVAIVLVRQRVLVLNYTGFRPEHRAELLDLVKASTDELLSSNRPSLFSQ